MGRIAALFDVHLGLLSDVSFNAESRDRNLTQRIRFANFTVVVQPSRENMRRSFRYSPRKQEKRSARWKHYWPSAKIPLKHGIQTRSCRSNDQLPHSSISSLMCIRCSSLISAYTELIDSMAHTAQDHVNIADGFTSQVVEVLRGVEKKNEEAKKTVSYGCLSF